MPKISNSTKNEPKQKFIEQLVGNLRNIELQDLMNWAEEMNVNPHLLQPLVDEMISNGEINENQTRSLSEYTFSLDVNLDEIENNNQPWCQPIII